MAVVTEGVSHTRLLLQGEALRKQEEEAEKAKKEERTRKTKPKK